MGNSNQTLKKQPSETTTFQMDFRGVLSLGDTITSINDNFAGVVSSKNPSPTSVTFGTVTSTSTTVKVQIIGGSHKTLYKITILVNTLLGDVLEGDGLLYVENT